MESWGWIRTVEKVAVPQMPVYSIWPFLMIFPFGMFLQQAYVFPAFALMRMLAETYHHRIELSFAYGTALFVCCVRDTGLGEKKSY